MISKKQLHLTADLLVNLALPWLVFHFAQPVWGDYGGLLASSVPPVLWSVGEFAWQRRVDALSLIVLAGIALSLGATLLGGDARLLLVRESLISGLIGLAFLGSLLTSKPLVYFLARATLARDGSGHVDAFTASWQRGTLRRGIRVITAAWGLGLCGEAVLRTWLAWNWPPERFLAVAPCISYGIMGCLFAWTVWYRRRMVKASRGEGGTA